ncbi:DUF3987 domain-containing protein [Bremerella cremea]|uniref:DUF3987 domain-containing protein n=1 Tax=Bremerella cremea TaxID=1031537 RepID=UPI0031EC0FCE
MNPVENVLSRLSNVRKQGAGWMACCPAHDDQNPSLSISRADNGNVLLKCFAGCQVEAVCTAAGLTLADLMAGPPLPAPSPTPKVVARYDYQDETGNLQFQVVRMQPKTFRQRRPDEKGGWHFNVKGIRVVPFRLPRLLADSGRVVFIVEGEKDVEALERIGCLATCNAGGALKWTADHSAFLKDRTVVILPDNDEPGRQHAQSVAMSLQGIALAVKVVTLPGLPEKGDVSDWLATGGTKEQLKQLALETALWEPGQEPWPEIDSIDSRDLPAFPTEVLPPILQTFVEAESHFTQTPPDMTAMLCLAVCGAALAKRVRIEARPGFSEPTNLFVCAILDPGNRKSAVFGDVTRPLKDIEREPIEEARPTVARMASQRRQDEKRLANLEKKGGDDPDARQAAIDLAAELDLQPPAVLPRLIVDDATGEKLGMMLSDQGGRLASFSPEGTVFDLMAGQYSKSGLPQMDVYLKGHNGDDLTTDRVGRETVQVASPALTCGYTVQKSVIESLNETKAFRGRGLLGRFLYAMPQSWIGRRLVACPPVPEMVKAAYDHLVRRLFSTEGLHVLQLTSEAAQAFQSWEVEAESMLAEGGELEAMRDWGAKLHGATLRLAGILHCVAGSLDQPVERSSVEAAIAVSRYLIPHAEAVFDVMTALEDPTTDGARYLVRWLDETCLEEFSRRDAHQHGRRKFKKVEDIDAPIGELIRRGYVRLKVTEAETTPGRKPSPRYEVNPALWKSEPPLDRPQNPQNIIPPAPPPQFEDSEYRFQQPQTPERIQVTL